MRNLKVRMETLFYVIFITNLRKRLTLRLRKLCYIYVVTTLFLHNLRRTYVLNFVAVRRLT